jgi:hypothetical protein
MAIPIPVLDDRSYEQLRDELLRRIEVYAPEWTDHGASDPGITLLELMAFMGENLLYRFNQIPDQTRLWLLRLLQVPPRPAVPARGIVTFTAAAPDAGTPSVELGSSLAAGSLPFRVGNDVRVLPLQATAVIKATSAPPTDPLLGEEYQRVLDAAGLAGPDSKPYVSDVLGADPAAPGFAPLDVHASVDGVLWVAVRAAPGVKPETVEALLKPTGPLVNDPIAIGVVTGTEFPAIDEVDPCQGLEDRPERALVQAAQTQAAVEACDAATVAAVAALGETQAPAVDTTVNWQVSTTVADADGAPAYASVTVAGDTTAGLTRDGVVSLQLPSDVLPRVGVAPLDDPDLAGVGNRPPVLGDDLPVVFWLRAFPRQGVPEIGMLRWLGLNAAEVVQVADAPPEFLGLGAGMPQQELVLAHASVVPGTLKVEVEEHGQWVPWQVVDTFAGSGPGDRHLVLDAADGRVRCGDSQRGRTLGIGDRIRAVAYRYGGGAAGNVAVGAVSKMLTLPKEGDVRPSNPVPTYGGQDPETISQALDRIPGELARHDRAVTAGDFRELASVQGVGRAECLPRFEPRTRQFEKAGVVSVMVWPNEDPLHPDAPVPDASLLRTVCQQLDERRLVTTELYVIPPTYRKVGVSVGLAVKKGFSPIGVRRWVELVLRQYLAPLPPYGPDGHGWSLGHRVYGPELEAAVLQVDGVEFIQALKVADLSGTVPAQGTVELEGWEVPELAELTVVLGTPPDPGTGGVGPPPAPSPVPVPVPREAC